MHGSARPITVDGPDGFGNVDFVRCESKRSFFLAELAEPEISVGERDMYHQPVPFEEFDESRNAGFA